VRTLLRWFNLLRNLSLRHQEGMQTIAKLT